MIDHHHVELWIARNAHLRPMVWAEAAGIPLPAEHQRSASKLNHDWDVADVVTTCRALGIDTLPTLDAAITTAESWAVDKLSIAGRRAAAELGRPVAVSPLDAVVWVLLIGSQRGRATLELLRYHPHICAGLGEVFEGALPALIERPVGPTWLPTVPPLQMA